MSGTTASITCSQCDRSFRWKPELAGRSVRCKCGTKLAVSLTPPPVVEPRQAPAAPEQEFNPFADMLDDLKKVETTAVTPPVLQTLQEPARSLRRRARPLASSEATRESRVESGQGHDPKLKAAGLGLLIHFGGFVVLGICLCVLVMNVMNNGMPDRSAPPDDFQRNFGHAFLTAVGMIFLGPLLCVGVPNQAGRGMLIGGLLSYFLAIALPYSTVGEELPSRPPMSFIVAFLASVVLMLIGTGFVLSFLTRLADYVESSLQAVADSLLRLYKYSLIAYILTLGVLIIPVVGAIANLVTSLMILVLIARYILLTGRLGFVMLRR